MDKKVTGIVAYITIIGWLVAFLAGDKAGAKFHLNQALVLALISIVSGIVCGFIPFIGGLLGWVISIFTFVCAILGIIAAAKDENKELPLIGKIKILN